MTSPHAELLDQRDTVWWYAVVDATGADDALARLGDPSLRLVRAGDLALVVSSDRSAVASRDPAAAVVPGTGVDEELARVAVHHDRVVSGLAELVPALVPIRFGTLANYQELSSLDADTAQRCTRLLERFRNRQEWGLRLMAIKPSERHDPADAPTGAEYLAAVRDRQRSRREAATRRDDLVSQLQRELLHLSDEAVQLSSTRPGQLVNLAYLVRRDRAAEFLEAVQNSEERLREHGVGAVVTGPWAPYSFTEIGPPS